MWNTEDTEDEKLKMEKSAIKIKLQEYRMFKLNRPTVNAEALQKKVNMLKKKDTLLTKVTQTTKELKGKRKLKNAQVKNMISLLRQTEALLVNTEKEIACSKNKLKILENEMQGTHWKLIMKMKILLKKQKTELIKKDKQLEEKERLLKERNTKLMEKEKQVQKRTDPDQSASFRIRNRMDLNFQYSSSEKLPYPEDAACFYVFPRQSKMEELSGDSQSTPSFDNAEELLSANTKVFIPKETEVTVGGESTTCYRFQFCHAGWFQCKFTRLVFEMEGEGEVLYRIVSWDARLLDGLGHMQPAGPLYDIDCKGSISHLHLPHCEIFSDQVQQAVAHVTAGNVEIIPPLRVTATHVIIRIQGFSLFGLLRNLFQANPIKGQILLFHKKLAVKQRRSKLHIHLLPRNVPVKEVRDNHPCSKYISTSSKCQLTPGRKYMPSCDPYTSQPQMETFECDYGPNYHPTFEVFIDTDNEDATVKIGLLDENKQIVWDPRLVILTDSNTEGAKLQTDVEGAAFVDVHRDQLIQRVSSVMEILDCLESKNMITKEQYNNINDAKPRQKQMRCLYDVLNSGGQVVKGEFYNILKMKQKFLVDELEAGTSKA